MAEENVFGTAARSTLASVAQGVGDCPAHLGHRVVVYRTHTGRERRPSDRVKAVAIDHRIVLDPGRVVENHLIGQAAHRSGDLSHGDQVAYVDHLRSGQHQHGPLLTTYVGQPNLTAGQSEP